MENKEARRKEIHEQFLRTDVEAANCAYNLVGYLIAVCDFGENDDYADDEEVQSHLKKFKKIAKKKIKLRKQLHELRDIPGEII